MGSLEGDDLDTVAKLVGVAVVDDVGSLQRSDVLAEVIQALLEGLVVSRAGLDLDAD